MSINTNWNSPVIILQHPTIDFLQPIYPSFTLPIPSLAASPPPFTVSRVSPSPPFIPSFSLPSIEQTPTSVSFGSPSNVPSLPPLTLPPPVSLPEMQRDKIGKAQL